LKTDIVYTVSWFVCAVAGQLRLVGTISTGSVTRAQVVEPVHARANGGSQRKERPADGLLRIECGERRVPNLARGERAG